MDAPTAAMSSNAPPDPELKAKLASLVGRLTTELGIGGGRSAEGLATASVAMLSKMISPYDVTKVAQQQSQRLLTERAPDPEAFAAQYSRLKALDVREVDKYLAVVAKIVADEDLLAAVTTPPALAPSPAPADARAAATTPAPIPASSSPATSSDRFDLSSARAVSDDDAGGRAAGADVSALPAVDGFSFSTNPLASDETFRGDDASASRGGTPARADGLRRLGDLSLIDPASPDAADDDDRDAMLGGERLRASVPELPDWCGARPFLTGAHLGNDLRGESDDRSTKPISEYSTACQELLLVDDLLYAMMGAEGRYVRAAKLPEIGRGFSSSSGSSPSGVVFELPAGLEPSLAALAERLLPLCSASHAVLRYVESSGTGYARGLCAHALAAEMAEALRDWRTVVAQLEHQRNLGRLSLQSTWYYCQPAASAMALLATVATDVARDLRGGALLAALREASDALAGDRAAAGLLARLSEAAAAPYELATKRWVYEGVVDDPYDEFAIVERPHLRKESLAEEYNAAYWTRRYTLRRREELPLFLRGDGARASDLAEKILATGKYVNAALETGGPEGDERDGVGGARLSGFSPLAAPPGGLGRLSASSDGGLGGARGGAALAISRAEAAHRHASDGLLRAVLERGDLRARLRSVKRYFLLDQGDFMVHFVDIAAHELGRRAPDAQIGKLQSLLELSLKLSSAASDPHGEDLACALERRGIVDQLLAIHAGAGGGGASESGEGGPGALPDEDPREGRNAASLRLTGADAFTLDYRAPWPVSLVLSRRALTKYQLLFRHIFHFKHVERELCAAWQAHQGTRGALARAGAGGRRSSSTLLAAHVASRRMLHFTQNFTHYLQCEVVEPNWHVLERDLDQATNADELIVAHDRFLDQCMKEGMLFWPKILKRLDRIKAACLRFAAATAAFARAAEEALASARNELRRADPDDPDDPDDPAAAKKKSRAVRHGDRRAAEAEAVESAARRSGFAEATASLSEAFDAQFGTLLETLNDAAHLEPNLASLCARLDFNEYYSFGPGGKYHGA